MKSIHQLPGDTVITAKCSRFHFVAAVIPCLLMMAGCGGDDTPEIVKRAREEKAKRAELDKNGAGKNPAAAKPKKSGITPGKSRFGNNNRSSNASNDSNRSREIK